MKLVALMKLADQLSCLTFCKSISFLPLTKLVGSCIFF